MTRRTDTSGAAISGTFSGATNTTRLLLACGVVAGPLFVVTALIQALTRTGFDIQRHPASLLSLGDLGWIQVANFVVSGLLFIVSAIGMRQALGSGRGRTWGPRLIGFFGAGLIAGGVFLPDPGLGFPPGTPEGMAETFSWHGILHAIAPVVGFTALIAACVVFARRFVALGNRGWAAYCVATVIVVLPLGILPNLGGGFAPLWLATTLGWLWASIVAARLMGELPA